MAAGFWNGFVKVTGWPVQKAIFRTKIFYEDKAVQGRQIKGPAILISNHTSVFDFAVFLFVFPFRTLRYQMAEVLFKKFPLGILLKLLGGIYVDRDSHNFAFIRQSEEILKKKGIVGIFPESRIPRPEEERPLPFKSSAAYLALNTNVPVIPIVTDGVYFTKKRAHVLIGTPFYARDLADETKSEKENLELVSEAMRQRVTGLLKLLEEHE